MAINELTILAIDDNQDNLTTLEAVIADRLPGTKILTALNGDRGIELALVEDPDVILLDIVMPGMDGYEVCRRIKENGITQTIPVIFLTALRTGRKNREMALEVGGEGFLTKPLDEFELIAQIRAMARIKQINKFERQQKVQLASLVADRTRELKRELAERKRAEEELSEANARFLSLADTLPGYIAYVNAHTLRYEFVNAMFEKSFELPREKIIGSHVKDIIGEEKFQFALQFLDAARQGRPTTYEGVFTFPSGKRWVQVNYIPVFDAGGEVLSLVVMGTDISDRKQAERALSESEARYRRITEGLTDYQYTVRVENGHALETRHSPACLMVTGYAAAEFAADPNLWLDMVLADDRRMIFERIQRVLAGEDIKTLEHRIIRKDGRIRWIRDTLIYHKDAAGTLLSYDGVVKDITEQKQIEAANQMLLQETQDRYHEISALMRASHAVLENRDFTSTARVIFDECKQQLGASAGYVALLNADGSENEVLFLDSGGKPCVVPDSLHMPIRGLRGDAYRLGKAVFDNDFMNSVWVEFMPEGHVALENVLFAPLPVHGRVVGLIGLANKPGGFNEDDARIATGFGGIAALVLANSRNLESLAKSEARFRSLVETATDAIISIDATGRITDWNHGAEQIFGYAADETVGRNISFIVPPRLEEAHSTALDRALAGGQLYHVGAAREVSGLRKDGSEVPVELTVSKWQTGEGAFFTSIIRDISERKQQDALRERLQGQLNQAQKMEAIGVLAGGIAHDFNNILGAILGYSEMAREDAAEGSQLAHDLDRVLTAAIRAKELVKQILNFSRQSSVDRIPIQLQPLIKESLKMLRASIPSTISISDDIHPDCGVVLADPTQIHQIAMNLCSNAFQAMEESGGELVVTLKMASVDGKTPGNAGQMNPGEYVVLTVSDTGKGIGPDIISNIFDPYFTTKEIGRGTGLGLSITHGIVKGYGGAITVESILGKGTTFRVYFPVIQEEEIKPEEPQETPQGVARVLFVDDEEALADMGRVMLERLGYTVTVHTHSIEALADFVSDPNKFDLVVSDQTMPNMTGIDLARRMLQIRPDMPIIICTGYSNLVNEESAKVIGIKALALKPLTKNSIGKLAYEVLRDARTTG